MYGIPHRVYGGCQPTGGSSVPGNSDVGASCGRVSVCGVPGAPPLIVAQQTAWGQASAAPLFFRQCGLSVWSHDIPVLERQARDTHHEVRAPQCTVFLPGGAGAIAVASEPLNMPAGFFLSRIVKGDLNDLVLWDRVGRMADDCAPELPSFVIGSFR